MEVVETGKQAESQGEALASVAVHLLEDAKDLETSNHVLHHETRSCSLFVLKALLVRELPLARLLVRQDSVFVLFFPNP